jgi:type II secretory pathway pseudopilin PulG
MTENQKNGYGIVEILVVLSIGMILFLSVSNFLNLSLKMVMDDVKKTEALSLARSSLEQARAVRDENQISPTADPKLGWTNISGLSFGSHYHFEPSGPVPQKWVAVAGDNIVGRYTVWVTMSQVGRNNAGRGDIVSAGGTIDPGTLKVTSNVSYATTSGTKVISLYEYLTNFK